MTASTSDSTALLIDGELVAGAGPALPVENPFTTETIVEVGAASAEQVDAAVAARLRRDAEELARTMTAEGG